jgi:Putative Flp pilus-assembly TadE/G-like
MPSNDARLGALRRRLLHEGGQVLPLTALLMVVLVGFGALVVDVGRIYLAQRQLQNAVDATALSVAQNMPDDYAGWCQAAGANASADCAGLGSRTPAQPQPPPLGYGGAAGAQNALFGYGVTAGNPTVTFSCSPNAPGYDPATSSCPADASTEDQPDNLCQPGNSLPPAQTGIGCNAVTVSETATVKSTLAGIFGYSGFNITANATASAPQTGSTPTPVNVEVILDTTPSMGPEGGACGSAVTGINRPSVPYGIDCAKAGVRALLSGLSPCVTTCTGNVANPGNALGANVTDPLDEVGLITYPALSNPANRGDEINCTRDLLGNNPMNPDVEYPTPYPPPTQPQPGYDIIGLSSDYRTSDDPTAPLNPSSNLVQSVYWTQCPGGVYPRSIYYGLEDTGQQSTYLAGAIAEAQYQLAHAPARSSGPAPVNVIIVLSDGQLNHVTFANRGNDNNPCASAAAAATAAKGTGTLIYSIAYDSTLNCTDNTGTYHNVRGLTLMQNIATPGTQTQTYFYNQPTTGDLTDIFTQISQALAQINTRLIPNP